MAPKDIYQLDVDFAVLALQFPAFNKVYVSVIQQHKIGPEITGVKDSKPMASSILAIHTQYSKASLFDEIPLLRNVRQLTKCLLARDFSIQIDLPDDRLCPPVRPSNVLVHS